MEIIIVNIKFHSILILLNLVVFHYISLSMISKVSCEILVLCGLVQNLEISDLALVSNMCCSIVIDAQN
jgi:hypothetical protein